MTTGGWFDPEAIEAERFEADCQQAEMEAIGRDCARAHRKMLRLKAAGDLMGAAQACRHGGGYPLASLAATNANDPRAGQSGVRCDDCGSVLSNFRWDGPVTILQPCEWGARH